MAENRQALHQDEQKVAGLIKALESCAKKGPGKGAVRCKTTTFELEGSGGITVNSWRFQDWDYKRPDLPVYARGLFTYSKKNGQPEIAIRGYDKFFNVGEVPGTTWNHIKSATKGPYELSVKENGCIIFISGLENNKLLVCSKHSTGARKDTEISHAIAGEKHLDIHLASVGKSRTDLARELRNRNATAVAELCDDDFEEHVLAYDQKAAGLYLHGINLNTVNFATYPSEQVHAFADAWGFKKAEYLVKDDVDDVRRFLEDCAETGSWNGRDTEGFVVRCQKQVEGSNGLTEDWFFKFKFEEPYLMYRQWRECTKAIISGRQPRFKKHKQITEQYLLYARRQLAKNPKLAQEYQKNHGIIPMRDGFLKERGLTGSDIIRQQEDEGKSGSADVHKNVVLVPIATIGCGKTTLAIALTKLFNWGHIQNDNIITKSDKRKEFANQVRNSLAAHPVVIADRNNHEKRERKQIMDDLRKQVFDARFVALHYVHDPKPEMLPSIRKITQERIFARGDNHQTIQAGSKTPREIISIMDGFLNRFEPVNSHEEPDDGFDHIIDLDVSASSRENLDRVICKLHEFYPKVLENVPPPNELDDAIQSALTEYHPDLKHDLSSKNNKGKNKAQNKAHNKAQNDSGSSSSKPIPVEYFSLSLPNDEFFLKLEEIFLSPPSDRPIPSEVFRFYSQLKQTHRLQDKFHVTLIHRASITKNPGLWSRLSSLHTEACKSSSDFDPVFGECQVQLETIVCGIGVMCIVVRLLDESWQTTNNVAHVTLGTATEGIKPKESNTLLEKWLRDGKMGGIEDYKIPGSVILHGSAKAVNSGRG